MWIDDKFFVVQKLLNNKEGKLLDFGARNQILKKFISKQINYTGVDILQNKDQTNIVMDLNQKIKFENNSFDFITALDVVEHLDDPYSFINESLRISKKQVYIVLPNTAYYEFRLMFLFCGSMGSKYHFSGKKIDDRHQWLTNYYSVNDFFNKNFNNFKVSKIFKTRNKLKFLYFFEKLLSKFFPNLFSWSFLIIISKA
jgi:predicted SAM-dependent methyltransferase